MLAGKPSYTLSFWSRDVRTRYRQLRCDALLTLVRARLKQPLPNEVDTFFLPGQERGAAMPSSWPEMSELVAQIVADATSSALRMAGDPTFFSQYEESGSTYVISYFIDWRHKTLVLTDIDVFC